MFMAVTIILTTFFGIASARFNEVKNQCSYPIYLRRVWGPVIDDIETLNPGATYTHEQRVSSWLDQSCTDPNNPGCLVEGGGVIRIGINSDNLFQSRDVQAANIYQLEYTWDAGRNKLIYDLSTVDGSPFAAEARHLIPTGPRSGSNCMDLNCAPGDASCEWPVQGDCAGYQDQTLYICRGQ